MKLQPLLHDLLAAVMAPTQAWSGRDGQIRPAGAQGVFHADVRVLSCAVVTVDGVEPEVVAAGPAGPGRVEAISLLRMVDAGGGADPTVRLCRRRVVTSGALHESLEVSVATPAPITLRLAVRFASDLGAMDAIKIGETGEPLPAAVVGTSVVWDAQGDSVRLTPGVPVAGAGGGAEIDLQDPTSPVVTWEMTVRPGSAVTVGWDLDVRLALPDVIQGPPPASTWSVPELVCADPRLPAFVAQSLDDLDSLRMSAAFAPKDVFLAAGAPWFFTLFGRDSLWAARMMLPLGTELAAGTLRTLALRQGVVENPGTAEQPGKILHEVRSKTLSLGDHGELPPLYYGTVDATPLWICLLHDAWRWGMPPQEVRELLPALEAALGWMADHGDADGDGFLEYLDETGRGLTNQGWKDSGDSVQWLDGRLAVGPIALCEVQGYAHEAAVAGADLLDAFGRPGADRWRRWAAELAARFREEFWVHDDEGPYPAIALDAQKRPVDTLTSNVGHLLGTGLLNPEEEAVVAHRLVSPALDSGYGLRTMATGSGGYWPLSYHGGSVWTHDTAIAVAGLARSGHTAQAAVLIEGLLEVADDFAYRVPELHSGDARGTVPAAVAYPAACRPQAWSAASAVVLLSTVLGLRPDVPAGRLSVTPMTPSPVGALEVRGLRVAGRRLDVDIDAEGSVRSLETDADLQLG